jgi:hypothetical protein
MQVKYYPSPGFRLPNILIAGASAANIRPLVCWAKCAGMMGMNAGADAPMTANPDLVTLAAAAARRRHPRGRAAGKPRSVRRLTPTAGPKGGGRAVEWANRPAVDVEGVKLP